jgi:hypothetical protein
LFVFAVHVGHDHLHHRGEHLHDHVGYVDVGE